jgi:hypothetical protein
MSQTERIKAHLERGQSITQDEGKALYGIGRVAPRIHELKKDGHNITKEMVKVRDRYGNTALVARYSMVVEPEFQLTNS